MKRLFTIVLLVLLSLRALAQGGTISGKVVDSSGNPVIGAAVFYEGMSQINTTTNFQGVYTIKTMTGKNLVFSCIGLKNKVVKVQGQGKIDVTMETDNMFLEDAVVIGYGEQQRQDLTGAVASVKADQLRKSADIDVLGSLRGMVAGLNISSHSGEPGAGYSINIRGNNSVNASSEPLIVIDGMQMDLNSGESA